MWLVVVCSLCIVVKVWCGLCVMVVCLVCSFIVVSGVCNWCVVLVMNLCCVLSVVFRWLSSVFIVFVSGWIFSGMLVLLIGFSDVWVCWFSEFVRCVSGLSCWFMMCYMIF